MTNDEFREWRERHFASRHAAAVAMEMSRDTIDALEAGETRNGSPFPVKTHIALACAAVDNGLAEFSSPIVRKNMLAAALREAAELIEADE